MDFGDDDLVLTLLTPRECNAFQIPPPSTARGHKAEDWRGKQIWKGSVTVINKTKGDKNICKCLVFDEVIHSTPKSHPFLI